MLILFLEDDFREFCRLAEDLAAGQRRLRRRAWHRDAVVPYRVAVAAAQVHAGAVEGRHAVRGADFADPGDAHCLRRRLKRRRQQFPQRFRRRFEGDHQLADAQEVGAAVERLDSGDFVA